MKKSLQKKFKKFKNLFNLPIAMTILLLAVLTLSTVVIMVIVRNNAQEEAFDTAWESVDDLIEQMKSAVENDWQQLETVGHVIGVHENADSEYVKNIMRALDNTGIISDLYLLLPDNRLMTQEGSYSSEKTGLDFTEEIKKGEYISKRMDSFADIGEKVVYYAKPILHEGTETGILYGIVRLNRVQEFFSVDHFNGQASVYLIEGETGKFLLDTWHDNLTGMDELGEMEIKPGYDKEQFRDNIRENREGVMSLMSKIQDEYVYLCYKPVGISDWNIALQVAESTMFAGFHRLRMIQIAFLAVMGSYIILYLAWILYYNGKNAAEKELELNQVNYISSIQKTLFDVHRHPGRMQEALELISDKLQAEQAFFTALKDGKVNKLYRCSGKEHVESVNIVEFSAIAKELNKNGNYMLFDLKKLKEKEPLEYESLRKLNVQNLMMTLVGNPDEAAIGILGVFNMKNRWEDTRYLDNVGISFFRACQNMDNQEIINEMANVDRLTGLLNRNRYEADLNKYLRDEKIPDACIYIDVNGLHELNNSQGHAAGDEMLRTVANIVRQCFNAEDTYRIGGDEFLVMVFGLSRDEITEKLTYLKEQTEANNYHISVGVEYSSENRTIEEMVTEAEKDMYEAKREYYKARGQNEKGRDARGGYALKK